MNKRLRAVSKGIYILSILSLFLPAFIPECTGEKTPEETNVITNPIIDSVLVLEDSTPVVSETLEDTIASQPERSIFYPDRFNQSFWGYLMLNAFEGLMAIFTLLSIWSGILRWLGKRDLDVALQISGALFCLLLFILSDYDKVVWGFWFTFAFTLINNLLSWRIWFLRSENP